MFLAVGPEREIVDIMRHIGVVETIARLINAPTLQELRIESMSDCQKDVDVLYH